MKTYYNKAYNAQYNILFKEAGEVLSTEDNQVSINTLDEYFQHIGELANKHTNAVVNEQDITEFSKFLLLPMDEVYGSDIFHIDVNSRAITVPATFAKNGVSLSGDVLAETLIFEVDRYVDTIDLMTSQIFVQWTNPKGEEGATKITIVDHKLKEGKIVFAWPLTQKITGKGQNPSTVLKFSIRFIRFGTTDTPVYSLSTLPASVNVKNNEFADFSLLMAGAEDPNGLLAEAIKNGIQGGLVVCAVPNITQDLAAVYYLDSNSKTETLKISAYASSEGAIAATWYSKAFESDEMAPMVGAGEEGFQAITSAEKQNLIKDKLYYDENGNIIAEPENYDETIYEKIYYLNIDKSGQYQAILKTVASNKYDSSPVNSQVASVPWIESVKASALNVENETATEESPLTLMATAIVTTGPQDIVVSDEHIIKKYVWSSKETENGEYVEIADATNETYSAVPGYYQVNIIAELNNTSKSDQAECVVYYPLVSLQWNGNSAPNNEEIEYTNATASAPITLTVNPDDYKFVYEGPLGTSGVRYQWYQQSKVDGGSNWEEIEGANEATYEAMPSELIRFKCNIYNILNGVESEPIVTNSYMFNNKDE